MEFGYECTSVQNCGFLTAHSSRVNSVDYCSISNCKAKSEYTMYHNRGRINISRLNLSNNNCAYTSALHCNPGSSFLGGQKIGSILLFCTFVRNNASQCRCIRFMNQEFGYEIINTNIVNNKQIKTSDGLIKSFGKTTIKNSCIMNNIGSPIFYFTNSQCTIINCSIDVNSLSVSGIDLNIEQKGSISFINEMSIIQLRKCRNNLFHSVNKGQKSSFYHFLYIFLQFQSISHLAY